MPRRIFTTTIPEIENKCVPCVHWDADWSICLFGLTSNNCGCFSEDVPYQMTQKDIALVRDTILTNIQGGKCRICRRKIEEGAAVLDHHHKKKVKGTGQIRGVLCRTCNVLLAKSENNCVRYKISQEYLPYILRNMAEYLQGKQYPHMHPSEKEPPKLLKKSSYNELTKAYREGRLKKAPPPWHPSGHMRLTAVLKRLFEHLGITPEFYK